MWVLEDDGWREWPLCEQCGGRRQTVCGFCGAAGVDFPLAEQIAAARPLRRAADAADAAAPPLLLCEACDEPFRPQFYRVCHRCGHEHADGREVGEEPLAVSPRILGVILALGLLAAIGGAYLTWLFR